MHDVTDDRGEPLVLGNEEARHKEFPLATILSITTGIYLKTPGRTDGSFGDIQEAIEWVAGHPVWTHELASKGIRESSAESVFSQHPQLKGVDGGLTKENHEEWTVNQVNQFGETLSLAQGTQVRTENPIESLQKMIGDKPVIPIVID